MRVFALLLGMTLVSPALALMTAPVTADSDIVLVLHAPWQSGAALVEAAGGRMIGPEQTAFALFAEGEQSEFLENLKTGGALAFDGTAIAALCGVKT